MKQLRWPTTLLLLGLAAALVTLLVLGVRAANWAFFIALAVLLLLLLATLFGRKGV